MKWIEHPFDGHVSQKNLALSHCSHEWVLCIDADEWVSPELADGIRQWLNAGHSAAGLKVIRKPLVGKANTVWGLWSGLYSAAGVQIKSHLEGAKSP